jgi:predicted nucleotide-binding protein
MAQINILLADNMAEHLETRKRLLEQAGYTVVTATSPDEALAKLRSMDIDVAVIDIRLEDDRDEKDVSGLLVARDSDAAIPKIMLTGFPSPETARRAMSALVPGGALAVDYVAKGQSDLLLKAIESAIRHKVFIAHGHDEEAKNAVVLTVKHLGLQEVVLHEQRNIGQAILDHFVADSKVGFAVVVLTPDDMGYVRDRPGEVKPRARQNVIFEFGYSVGVLGLQRVCVLYKDGVDLPQYLEALYLEMDPAGLWKHQLAGRMQQVGLPINVNRLR